MRKERKHYTAEEKVAILRRHLLDKVPVSNLCEELDSLARNARPFSTATQNSEGTVTRTAAR
jgi:transposase-like protein